MEQLKLYEALANSIELSAIESEIDPELLSHLLSKGKVLRLHGRPVGRTLEDHHEVMKTEYSISTKFELAEFGYHVVDKTIYYLVLIKEHNGSRFHGFAWNGLSNVIGMFHVEVFKKLADKTSYVLNLLPMVEHIDVDDS